MTNSLRPRQFLVEEDGEQGYSSFKEGCNKWPCYREVLVVRGPWIVCSKCGGSYGEATPENVEYLYRM